MQVHQLSDNDLHKLDETYVSYINKKMVPSLSKLINDDVIYQSSNTNELGLEEISTIVPQTEFNEDDVGIYINCEGDMTLGILFHLPLGRAKKLASVLVGNPDNSVLTSDGRSSLSEIGNILAASLFNAINEKSGCKIMSSVPGFAIDTAESLLESPIIETAISTTFIHSHGELKCKKTDVTIYASIFQDPSEARKILAYH